jgi:hypothetical protein
LQLGARKGTFRWNAQHLTPTTHGCHLLILGFFMI